MADRRTTGWGDPQRQTCKACGMPDKFNFYVPDEIWAAVVPESLRDLVVCLGCFDDFARSRGVDYATSLHSLYFVGDQANFRLEPVEVWSRTSDTESFVRVRCQRIP